MGDLHYLPLRGHDIPDYKVAPLTERGEAAALPRKAWVRKSGQNWFWGHACGMAESSATWDWAQFCAHRHARRCNR